MTQIVLVSLNHARKIDGPIVAFAGWQIWCKWATSVRLFPTAICITSAWGEAWELNKFKSTEFVTACGRCTWCGVVVNRREIILRKTSLKINNCQLLRFFIFSNKFCTTNWRWRWEIGQRLRWVFIRNTWKHEAGKKKFSPVSDRLEIIRCNRRLPPSV